MDRRIEPREFLSLTLAFDHDVIDGAPAARFVRRVGGADRDRIWTGRRSRPWRLLTPNQGQRRTIARNHD